MLFVFFPNCFLLLISSFIPLWSVKVLDMISIFLNLLRFVSWKTFYTYLSIMCNLVLV